VSRIVLFWLASSLAAHAQSAAFRWIRQIGGSGGETIVGIATDASGNTYVAGNTASLDFPVQSAVQPHPGAAGIFRVDGPGSNWRALYQSGVIAATSVVTDPLSPRTVYAATLTEIHRSTDAGDSWTTLGSFHVSRINSLTIDPTDGRVLYLATDGQGILTSTDAGATWSPINTGHAIGLHVWVDPTRPSHLFVETSDGGNGILLQSTDRGATWQPVVIPGTDTGFEDVAFDPFRPDTVYVTGQLGGGISTDGGLTWNALGRIDPRPQPDNIVPDPSHPGVLYGGAQDGVWRSADSGKTWSRAVANPSPVITSFLALDRSTGASYAVIGHQLVVSTDGFAGTAPIGPPAFPTITGLSAAGGRVFAAAQSSSDVFVAKFDPQGNPIFATYFGGSSIDEARAMAVDPQGAVYVTGSTNSRDFPITSGAYAANGPGFLFKLNPDGTLLWSTYWAAQPYALTVDSAGHAYLAGVTYIGLPITPGAYETTFEGFGLPLIPQVDGYVTEFDSAGASLVFSTYLGGQGSTARAIALFPDGAIAVVSDQLYLLDPTGSSLLARAGIPGQIRSMTAIPGGLLIVGGTPPPQELAFPTTPGAFQTAQHVIPDLPGSPSFVNGGNAFVMKVDRRLNIVASTLLGGEATDAAFSAAADPQGNIIVGGLASSKAFPARGPIQGSFAPTTGFVSQLTPDLSSLAFSTFTGDTRIFNVQSLALAPDGGILIGGATNPTFQPALVPDPTMQAFLVRMDRLQAAPPRIDSVVNAASQLGVPLSPGEIIQVHGESFAADAALNLNGAALPLLDRTTGVLTAVVPADFTSDAANLEVRSAAGRTSMLVPGAPAAPGVYLRILNGDGTVNAPPNPAVEGDTITLFATGVGLDTQAVDVRVDGISVTPTGVAIGPVDGFLGNVYRTTVFVPVNIPSLVAVAIRVNGAVSQAGVPLYVGR
jgi:uncharacterized protein (TIGR03437 family)